MRKEEKIGLKYLGFKRPDGKVGVRNHVIILPSVVCSSEVCQAIAKKVQGIISSLIPTVAANYLMMQSRQQKP
jgi:altronate dehydratase large subunit